MRDEYDFSKAGPNILAEVTEEEFRDLVWRWLCRMSAKEFADRCDVSPATVRRWLMGDSPVPTVRRQIKEFMGKK